MDSHINIAGIIHLIMGGLGLLAGICVTAFVVLMGGLGGLGALAEQSAGAGEALAVFGSMGILGMFIGGFIVFLSLPQMLAGYGLMRRRAWAPMVALIVSMFQLLSFPIGTVVACYTGWVLLSSEGQRAYKMGGSRYGRLA